MTSPPSELSSVSVAATRSEVMRGVAVAKDVSDTRWPPILKSKTRLRSATQREATLPQTGPLRSYNEEGQKEFAFKPDRCAGRVRQFVMTHHAQIDAGNPQADLPQATQSPRWRRAPATSQSTQRNLSPQLMVQTDPVQKQRPSTHSANARSREALTSVAELTLRRQLRMRTRRLNSAPRD